MYFKTIKYIVLATIIIGVNSGALAAEKDFSCEHSTLIHTWKGTEFKLYVCSYGSPPILIRKNWWRGSGLSFSMETNDNVYLIKDHSEYYPEMDYSFQGTTLTFVVYTHQPKKDKFVETPFIRETYMLTKNKYEVQRKLLLAKPKPNQAEVNRLISILSLSRQQFEEKYPSIEQRGDVLDSSLYMLRNFGLNDPKYMIERLKLLKNLWWIDGAGAELLRDIKNELQIVSDLSE
jgi:hypothetical protein